MVYTIYVKEYSSDQIYTFLGDTIDHSFDECKIIFSKHYECKGGPPVLKSWRRARHPLCTYCTLSPSPHPHRETSRHDHIVPPPEHILASAGYK